MSTERPDLDEAFGLATTPAATAERPDLDEAFGVERPDLDEAFGTAAPVPVAAKPPARDALAKALQDSKLFGSATSAMGQAQDKNIRRGKDGNWDLPPLTPNYNGGLMDSAAGALNTLDQKIGGRLGRMHDGYQGIQDVFHKFQQDNNLSDEEVTTAWADLGNQYRKWDDTEKTRTLSDGELVLNPQAPEILDNDAAVKLIEKSGASAESKARAIANLSNTQTQVAADKLESYEAAAQVLQKEGGEVAQGGQDSNFRILPLESPSQWGERTGRKDLGSPTFVRDYEREVIDKQGGSSAWVRGIASDVVLGFNKLYTTVAGVAGAAGGDAAAKQAVAGSEAGDIIAQGKTDTGMAGAVVQELPSLGGQIVTGRLLGVAGGVIGSARTAQTFATVGVLATAGAQSAGMTYAQQRAAGKDHETAQATALRAGVSTAVITGIFQKLGAGGVEAVAAGKPVAGVTMRDLLASATKAELLTNTRKFAGEVLKATGGEATEEGIDQLVSAFITADPDTNLADAWEQAVEAAKIGGVLGGGAHVVSAELEQATRLAAAAAPAAPAAAQAAAAVIAAAPTVELSNEQPATVLGVDGKPVSTKAPTLPLPAGFDSSLPAAPAPPLRPPAPLSTNEPATVATKPGDPGPGVSGTQTVGVVPGPAKENIPEAPDVAGVLPPRGEQVVANGAADAEGTAPAVAVPISRQPAENVAPRADKAVEPRPQKRGSDRDAWDETYGVMTKGGRRNNDDGTPYQPTKGDEVIAQVTSGTKGNDTVANIAAIGVDSGVELPSAVRRLVDDGWVWSEDQKKMVNPRDPSESPAKGLARLKGGPAVVAATPEPAPAPEAFTPVQRQQQQDFAKAVYYFDKSGDTSGLEALGFTLDQIDALADATQTDHGPAADLINAELVKVDPALLRSIPASGIREGELRDIFPVLDKLLSGDPTKSNVGSMLPTGTSEANRGLLSGRDYGAFKDNFTLIGNPVSDSEVIFKISNGVAGILVNPRFEFILPQLTKLYPGVNFVTAATLRKFLTSLAATPATTSPTPAAPTAEAPVKPTPAPVTPAVDPGIAKAQPVGKEVIDGRGDKWVKTAAGWTLTSKTFVGSEGTESTQEMTDEIAQRALGKILTNENTEMEAQGATPDPTPDLTPDVAVESGGGNEAGAGVGDAVPGDVKPPKVGNTGAIPTAEEAARWDAVDAYNKPLVEAMEGDALDALGDKAGVKRQGVGDEAYRKKILDSTHPDDLLDALSEGTSEGSAGGAAWTEHQGESYPDFLDNVKAGRYSKETAIQELQSKGRVSQKDAEKEYAALTHPKRGNPPATLSPDEYAQSEFVGRSIYNRGGYPEDVARDDHRYQVGDAVVAKEPVSAAAVDSYGIKLPDGYVKQGDLYVYQDPVTPPTESPKQDSPSPEPALRKAVLSANSREEVSDAVAQFLPERPTKTPTHRLLQALVDRANRRGYVPDDITDEGLMEAKKAGLVSGTKNFKLTSEGQSELRSLESAYRDAESTYASAADTLQDEAIGIWDAENEPSSPLYKKAPASNATQGPPLITPEERANLIQQDTRPSESVQRMEAEEVDYQSRPRKQTGADLQKEYQAQQKAIAAKPAVAQPLPYSPEALQSVYDATPEQAVAIDALVQAMGVDTARVKLQRGGKPESGSLSQESGEADAEYLELAKDPEGNREALQGMVDEAARKAMSESVARPNAAPNSWNPYQHDPSKPLIKLFHGGEKGITSFSKIFDRPQSGYKQGNVNSQGVWLTQSRGAEGEIAEFFGSSDAASYAQNYDGGGQIYDVYANITNPKRMSHRDTQFTTAKELLEQGYDGVYTIDSGFWVALKPEQIKSADPVTRDSDGNIIPLSQRFNSKSPSILYQRSGKSDARFKELTADIDPTPEGIERFKAERPGAYAELKELRKNVLSEAGYDIGPVWRGDAGSKRVDVLDPSRPKDAYDNGPATLFATNKKLADYYDENQDARSFYLKSDSMLSKNVGQGYKGGHWASIRPVVMQAKREGNDAVFVEDVTDGPGIRGNVYGILNSNQAKLAEPLALGPDGTLIPPSAWADAGNPSILYQRDGGPLNRSVGMPEGKIKRLTQRIDAMYSTGRTRGVEDLEVELERLLENADTNMAGMEAESAPEFDAALPSPEQDLVTAWYRWTGRGEINARDAADFKKEYGTFGKFYRSVIGDGAFAVSENATDKQIEEAAKDAAAAYERRRSAMLGSPAVLYQFAGENAVIPQFMRDSLDTARSMAAAGKTSEEIRAVTGWFPGKYDGKMRWEIPDAGAKLKKGWEDAATLGDALDHPALFEAYPALRGVGIAAMSADEESASGAYDPPANRIFAGGTSKKSLLSTLIHEVQHAIQQIEGTSKGSNPGFFTGEFKPENRSEISNALMDFNEVLEPLGIYRMSMDDMEIYDDAFEAVAEFYEKAEPRLDEAGQDQLQAAFQKLTAAMRKGLITPQDAYNRTAGEIEARDVQARRNFTPEQRAATAPYSSENIAPEAAIVLNQQSDSDIKGSMELLPNGDFLLRGLKNPDVSTPFHELYHVADEMILLSDDDYAVATREHLGITDEMLATYRERSGFASAKTEEEIVAAKEKTARWWERYLRDGRAPSQELAPLFARISEWFKSIYKVVEISPIADAVPPEVRAIFDKLAARTLVDTLAATPPEPLVPDVPPVSVPSATPAPDSATGLKHAVTDEDRARYGLKPRFPRPVTTDQDAWDSAIAAEDRNPGIGARLLDELISVGVRVLTKYEHALLLHEKLTRQQAVDAAHKELNRLPAGTEVEQRRFAAARVQSAQEAFDTLITFTDKAGSAAGLSLQARKMMVEQDFTLAAVANRMLAAKNKHADTPQTLTPQESQRAAELSEQLTQAQARADALDAENKDLQTLVEKLTADVEKAQKASRARDLAGKSKIKAKLDPMVAAAKERLAAKGVKFLAQDNAMQPDMLKDFAVIGAGWLVDQSLTLKEFAAKLTSTFGTWITEHAETIFKLATQTYHETAESVQGRAAPKPEEVIDGIDGEEPLTRQDVWALARAHVIMGLRGNNVLDAVFSDLLPIFPDLTREQVATLFTDYGKVSYPSKAEVPVELNRIRNLERIALKILDLKAGIPPKRTGFQRGEQDAEIRAAEKEFRALLKESGLQVVDPALQLQSALGAAKRRMSNEIEELEMAIAKGKPRDSTRTSLEYDEEALALKSQLEAKRAEYNAAFGTGTTEAKRLENALKALDRQIREEDKMLADGVLKRPKGQPIKETPELADKRRQLADKRQIRRALYEAANPGESALQQAKNAALKSIERLQGVLASGDVAIRTKTPVTPDAELQALWDARETLSDEVNELRRALPLSPEKEARQIEAALRSSERTLARLQDKLARNDLSVPAVTSTPASRNAAVIAVREEVKKLALELAARRRDAKPKMDPEVARIHRALASIAKRKTELQRRLADKDFDPKPKPLPLNSPEVRRANYELDLLKATYYDEMGKLALKNAKPLRKLGFVAIQFSNLLKSLKLGLDFGIALRNIGGITMNLAFRDVKMLTAMQMPFTEMGRAARRQYEAEGSSIALMVKTAVKTIYTPELEHSVYEYVRNRPGAIHDKNMTYVAPFDGAVLQKEDIPRANIIEQTPWWVWPVVGGLKWWVVGLSPPAGLLVLAAGAMTKPALTAMDRAQRTVTNLMRARMIDMAVAAVAPDGGISRADLAALSRAVMVASGRGSTKLQWLESATPMLNIGLLSTRYYLSRIQALTFNPLWASPEGKVSGDTRKEIARMYGRSVTVRAAIYGLAAMMFGVKWLDDDDDDNKREGMHINPLSSKFGVLSIKGSNGSMAGVDFMSGVNTFATLAARIAMRRKVTADGEVVKLEGSGYNDMGDTVVQFLAGKRNVALGFVWDSWKGEYYGGVDANFGNMLEQATSAIIINDTKQIFETLGPVEGAEFWALMFTGAGTRVRLSEREMAAQRRKRERAERAAQR